MKVSPIIRAVQRRQAEGTDISCKLVYTGRSDDFTLEPDLFANLQMPPPDVYLQADDANLNALTGQVMNAFEAYLCQNPTDVVIVVDDLASTMAASIVTKKRGLLLAHLVAGTRSFDINMPKEVNRLVIDGLSDYLFTAGDAANSIVFREGANEEKVYCVGNILIDTLRLNRSRLRRPPILDENEALRSGEYIVFTLNRRRLIDNRELLYSLVEAFVAGAGGVPIVAPLRKEAQMRVQQCLEEVAMRQSKGVDIVARQLRNAIHFVGAMPYLEFGYLTAHALGIVTDSGNVAEEATFNAVPCATLNSYTEHIETVREGSNVLTGEDPEQLRNAVEQMVRHQWKGCALPAQWDGRAAERIVQILCDTHSQTTQ